MTKGTVTFFAISVAVPLVANAYQLDVLTSVLIYAMLALGLNLIVGLAGLLHLGYAAFFAIGAYTYALLNIHWGWSFWVGWAPAVLIAALGSGLVGASALRVRGDYLAIVTLGFGEIIRLIFNNLDQWTGGPNGLLGIAHPTLWLPQGMYDFSVKSLPYYYLSLVLLGGVWLFCHRLSHSRLGRAWMAMRDDELAAACMGIPVLKMKLLVQICGGAVAGLAGAFFAAKQGTVTPDSFDFIQSVMVLSMVVLGGMGSMRGAILGAMLLGVLPEMLRGADQYRMLVFGLSMIVMMRLRPQGLLGRSHKESQLAAH